MDMAMGGLDPRDFAATAQRAVAACAGAEPAVVVAEAGLLGVLAPEEVGGLGLDARFAVAVVEAAGAGDLAFPLIETLLLSKYLADAAPEVAAALVDGTARGSIAWGGRQEAGMVNRAPMGAQADWLLVRQGEGAALLPAAALTAHDVVTLDETVPEHAFAIVGPPAAMLGAAAWADLNEEALLLRAALMLGAAEAALWLAVEHVSTRRQFGKPLVAFQAMRHLLARQKLLLEGMRGAITRGLHCPPGAVARQAAFLFAAANAPLVAEAAIQAHGGMGFTWDVPVHRHLRRIRALEAQGDAPALREAMVDALMELN